ncbi:type II toxin-antitoxin system VapC family toxin [Thermodesulfobacteriota bacterium]
MKRFLIDTNIYSYALKGEDEVVDVLKEADEIGFSVISIGELLSGFKLGRKEQKNRKELELFLDSPRVVVYPVNEGTAEFYAQILNNLRKIGKPVPTNDIWIAAVTFQNGLKLYTKDNHFQAIPGLYLI